MRSTSLLLLLFITFVSTQTHDSAETNAPVSTEDPGGEDSVDVVSSTEDSSSSEIYETMTTDDSGPSDSDSMSNTSMDSASGSDDVDSGSESASGSVSGDGDGDSGSQSDSGSMDSTGSGSGDSETDSDSLDTDSSSDSQMDGPEDSVSDELSVEDGDESVSDFETTTRDSQDGSTMTTANSDNASDERLNADNLCAGLTSECGEQHDDDGNQLCSYNRVTNQCFEVVSSRGIHGRGGFDTGYTAAQRTASLQKEHLQMVMGIMGGVLGVLALITIFGAIYLFSDKFNKPKRKGKQFDRYSFSAARYDKKTMSIEVSQLTDLEAGALDMEADTFPMIATDDLQGDYVD